MAAGGSPDGNGSRCRRAETGSPRAGGAPGNRITGSPGGRGGRPPQRPRPVSNGRAVRARDPRRRPLSIPPAVTLPVAYLPTRLYIARGVRVPRLRISLRGYCGQDNVPAVPRYTCVLSVYHSLFYPRSLTYTHTQQYVRIVYISFRV